MFESSNLRDFAEGSTTTFSTLKRVDWQRSWIAWARFETVNPFSYDLFLYVEISVSGDTDEHCHHRIGIGSGHRQR